MQFINDSSSMMAQDVVMAEAHRDVLCSPVPVSQLQSFTGQNGKSKAEFYRATIFTASMRIRGPATVSHEVALVNHKAIMEMKSELENGVDELTAYLRFQHKVPNAKLLMCVTTSFRGIRIQMPCAVDMKAAVYVRDQIQAAKAGGWVAVRSEVLRLLQMPLFMRGRSRTAEEAVVFIKNIETKFPKQTAAETATCPVKPAVSPRLPAKALGAASRRTPSVKKRSKSSSSSKRSSSKRSEQMTDDGYLSDGSVNSMASESSFFIW